MQHTQSAFAPAHITGFFEPVIDINDFTRTGSRGSGFSIKLGATSKVLVKPDFKQTIITYWNNRKTILPVTTLAIQKIIKDMPLKIKVETFSDLPLGQGFGISGAGALSTTKALAKLLDKPQTCAIEAAHFAEVKLKTGLGDVIGSSFGGIEIRKKAGLPPWGIIEHIPGSYEVIFCIIENQIKTNAVLNNNVQLKKIIYYGRRCMQEIIECPSPQKMFELSTWFAKHIGMQPLKVENAIQSVSNLGNASQCMLGNTIFAIGDTKTLIDRLSSFGRVIVTSIDTCGARLLLS